MMFEQAKRVSVGAMASLLPLASHPFWGCEGRLPVSVPIICCALAVVTPAIGPLQLVANERIPQDPSEASRLLLSCMPICRMNKSRRQTRLGLCIRALTTTNSSSESHEHVTPLLESSLPASTAFVTAGLVLIQELPHCVLPKASFKLPHE